MASDTRVVVIAPGGARRTYRLTRFPVVVGSDPACDITVVASEEIAPRQVRIDRGTLIVDLAGNGTTTCKGTPVTERQALDRDVFDLADIRLEIYISAARTGAAQTGTTLALEVLSGDCLGQTYRLDREITIGRTPDNSFPARQPDLSGHHAALRIIDGLAVIEDVGSRNGTTVNGENLTPKMPRSLSPGDLIDLASLGLLVVEDDGTAQQIEAPAAAKAPVPGRPPVIDSLRTVGNAPVVADDIDRNRRIESANLPILNPPIGQKETQNDTDEYEVDLDALRFDDDD